MTGPDSSQQVTLETPRLILRAAQESDAVGLYEAFRDPEVMRYWSTPPHPSIETTHKWVSSMTNSSQNGITDFIIILKNPSASPNSSRIAIGKIGIYRALPSNEFGFLLSRAHWGKGLAKEAIGCVLEYYFALPPVPTSSDDQDEAQPLSNDHDGTTDVPPTAETYTTLTTTDLSDPHCRYLSVSADVDPRNQASRGLLTRMGFTEVGYIEKTDYIGGEWVDSVYYQLRREN